MTALTPEDRLRIGRHAVLAIASAGATVALAAILPGELRGRISTATAYVALALLTVTLALGPLNVLRGRPNPLSFNLRRDFGIWAAVVGVGHAAIGLTVHLRGRMHLYFVAQPGHPNVAGLRTDTFGVANDTGLLAALLLVVLALISSDYALRLLGTTRWRTIQRSAYFIAAFTIVHAAGYQWIEKPRWWRVGLVVVAAAGLLGVQLAGRRRHRRAARP